jgi:uncharacterized protein YcfL
MDLSLLVHTCDSYQQYWFGMLYGLDFNWNFEKVPVYWASEEKNVHDINLSCRNLPYTVNPGITPILTGLTDKNGFSTRMRLALERIPSKWVIYIQEDMWPFSYPGDEVLEELVSFVELHNANSIKIHTKLHYYESYKLEPTPFEINKKQILKYSDGENYLHSHNATIWDRNYLLKHLADGEDPWTNEVNGSKRMSSGDHNHFHYNIYWYCQPGVCEMGKESKEFFILGPIMDDLTSLRLQMQTPQQS